MKKFFFLFSGLALLFSSYFCSFSSAITVQVPRNNGNQDVMIVGPEQIKGDETSFFETIQTINQYLWFGLGAICMGVLVFGGIRLITANGDDKASKETSKLLMGAVIGILVCMLSYSVVRLVINIWN